MRLWKLVTMTPTITHSASVLLLLGISRQENPSGAAGAPRGSDLPFIKSWHVAGYVFVVGSQAGDGDLQDLFRDEVQQLLHVTEDRRKIYIESTSSISFLLQRIYTSVIWIKAGEPLQSLVPPSPFSLHSGSADVGALAAARWSLRKKQQHGINTQCTHSQVSESALFARCVSLYIDINTAKTQQVLSWQVNKAIHKSTCNITRDTLWQPAELQRPPQGLWTGCVRRVKLCSERSSLLYFEINKLNC